MLKYAKPSAYGFTLIELSIVLVIIGLIFGGILIGRDLIAAAEIRRFITQIEQYNAAVNVFKDKYRGLPGDLVDGTSFGFKGNGNGDKCIGLCNSGSLITDLVLGGFSVSGGWQQNEMSMFWSMLSDAKLISGTYDGATADFSANPIGTTIPATAVDGSIGLLAYYGTESVLPGWSNTRHYITMTSYVSSAFQLMFDVTTQPHRLKAVWAQSMDKKMDDGSPGAGRVRAGVSVDGFFDQVAVNGDDTQAPSLPLAAGQNCTYVPSGSTQWIYNVADAAASCWMRFEGGF
ncbi:MAG: prepilin-type N-terminal cleavage/methylation domain-containing protein [Rickettsiales bacterium]|jgi:prepilin-type N-terminal cleavage/methylation domain-containing protein|nr:prepilin-type N-terminal cleavage/methylation domain-containing protein [Rickettsiales bacterium]